LPNEAKGKERQHGFLHGGFTLALIAEGTIFP